MTYELVIPDSDGTRIERAESGRHLPSSQSLAQIAAVFGVDVTIFDPVDDEAFRRKVEKAA
jgi:transcriptional regulator with XRE-family HTH domain